jgi:uncharacterized protein (UPF0332 family)/predicted nucleotidyltransferase
MVMTPSTIREQSVLTRIRAAVSAIDPGARAILYGSRARGDADQDSDWDLLLISACASSVPAREALEQRLQALFAATGALVQPVWVSEQEWQSPISRVSPFHANVEEDGVQLLGPPLPQQPLTEEEMTESRDKLAQQWIGLAWESLDDAAYNAEDARLKTCVGRLYYACFYAVSALFIQRGFRFSKHASVHGLFNQEYGPSGDFPRDLIDLYNTLFKARLEADYAPTAQFDAETVQSWLTLARSFVEKIEALLESAG